MFKHIREREDPHSVGFSYSADMVGSSDGTSNRCFLVAVGKTLASKVSSASLGDLDDDGSLDVSV